MSPSTLLGGWSAHLDTRHPLVTPLVPDVLLGENRASHLLAVPVELLPHWPCWPIENEILSQSLLLSLKWNPGFSLNAQKEPFTFETNLSLRPISKTIVVIHLTINFKQVFMYARSILIRQQSPILFTLILFSQSESILQIHESLISYLCYGFTLSKGKCKRYEI